MRKSETYKSNFLKADNLSTAAGKFKTMVVTITEVSSHEFDDGKKQRVLSFKETEQQLGLNLTNWDSCCEITGKDDDDLWVGAQIELWVDKTVMYGGKKIPAIRIRPVAEDNGNPPAPPAPGAYSKRDAWNAFCAAATKAGVKPDPEAWKSLVESVMGKKGKAHQDLLNSDDWKFVTQMIDAPEPLKADDIPF